MKAVIRHFNMHALRYKIDWRPGNRNTITRLASLTMKIMSSDRFTDMRIYPWVAAGLTTGPYMKFTTPSQYCFKDLVKCALCSEYVFVRCPDCDTQLCWTHFFDAYHYDC